MKGFTIVETLIVLAIAGLILLLVFEAIPALERSSRNNQRRQDIQSILAAISHYELNNSGNAFPSACGASPSSSACTDGILHYTTLTYYDAASGVSFHPLVPLNGAQGPVTSLEKVEVYNYQKCDPTNVGKSTDQGAGYTDIVALYAVETGSSYASQCQQL